MSMDHWYPILGWKNLSNRRKTCPRDTILRLSLGLGLGLGGVRPTSNRLSHGATH